MSVKNLSARMSAKRDFLVKQRRLCVEKGFVSFETSGNMSVSDVVAFFNQCPEVSILVLRNRVHLSKNR